MQGSRNLAWLLQDGALKAETRGALPFDHVLWVGGGCGAGKTSVARHLAHRFDLQLYAVDAHGWEHHRRLGGGDLGGHDARWLRPTPEELAERFLVGSRERLPLILDDLRRMADLLVVAEGAQLFPDLVMVHLASPAHGVWLVPTDEFQQRTLRRRGGMESPTSNPERAVRNRLARDALLNDWIRHHAARLGLPVLAIDGRQTLPEVMEAVAARFAGLIAAGPRARNAAERRRIRQAENLAVHSNLAAHAADVGLREPPSYAFACECGAPGCTDTVLLSIDEYRLYGAG